MRPLNVLSWAMNESGYSGASLARALGRSDAYVRNYYHKGITPSVDNYTSLLDACGFDLIARSRSTGKECMITAENEDSVESYTEL